MKNARTKLYSSMLETGYSGRDRAVHGRLLLCLLLSAAWLPLLAASAVAHKIYIANDNHTDYGWNATTTAYDAAMLGELDYYLGRIAATAGNAPAEQSRFNCDNWYYLYLYEKNRSPAQYQTLISRILDGHITVPLNPFVELYGGMPTEAAIRAGYYPGKLERLYGTQFLLAQEMETATIPWGLVELWAGSKARYSWKGICECFHQAPYQNRTDEVFRWQGPDNSEILMKWYQTPSPSDSGQTHGGYAEMRGNQSQGALQNAITRFASRPPFLPITGLFGAGWDDVAWKTDALWQLAQSWNAAHPGGDQAIMSNGVDYFLDLEAFRSSLGTVRGGWGNDWDAWPAKMASETARVKRAVEKLRSAEAMAALAQWGSASFWPAHQPAEEAGLISTFKFFEHTWADGGAGLAYVIGNKQMWASDVAGAVDGLYADASARVASFFATPAGEDRVAVFNPLDFSRTDVVDLPVSGPGPYTVTDLAAAAEVPSQVITLGGTTYLRFLASQVPSIGYRVYRYAAGAGGGFPPAATITGSHLSNSRYAVTLGSRGQITSLVEVGSGRDLVGTALNDFGSGTAGSPVTVNAGPVSTTLRVDISGSPARRVSVTLFQPGIDRVVIEDEILQNYAATSYYKFNVSLPAPQLHFEEVGAVARPGLVSQGGDFQPGTRADLMTLNHFAEFEQGGYRITLSNRDAIDFKAGNSTAATFDLTTPEINVLALGVVSPLSGDISDQAGANRFLHEFALRGTPGNFSGADAMRFSLAHQNPLVPIPLPRGQVGTLVHPTRSLFSHDGLGVVALAMKPVEEASRGILVRFWELDNQATSFTANAATFNPQALAETSLNETDLGTPALNPDGTFAVSLGANAMKTFRFVPGAFTDPTGTTEQCGDCIDNDGDGLVDYEDPDCCAQLLSLSLKHVSLRAATVPGRGALRVKAIYASPAPPGFDPLSQDTSFQVVDASGPIFCATVAASHWTARGSRRVTFRDATGSFAGGLGNGDFVRTQTGPVVFDAAGRKLQLRATDGHNVRFTVRVGGQCSRTSVDLGVRKKHRVFP